MESNTIEMDNLLLVVFRTQKGPPFIM